MRKQLYFFFLLLLSVQLAIAQTARYEYWFDNGYQGRTVVANSATDVALNLDISNLKPGLHYFNVRAQGQSNQWGGLSRYLFFIREEADPTASFMTKYEYWLDNNYSERIVVNGAATDVALNLDISNLKPGLHYFNVRTQGQSGQWGGLSRYLFFIREEADPTASSMSKYEYWLDNNYSERIVVNGAATDVALNLDISSLKPGLHYFNVRAQGKSGQWGGLSRYLFYLKENNAVGDLSSVEYWIDSRQNVMAEQVSGDEMVLTVDISTLKKGTHTFYLEGVGSNGSRSLLDATEFTVETDPVVPVPEPYAALSENNTVLTFYYDTEKEQRNGMSVGPFENVSEQGWENYCTSITKVIFDESFAYCTELTSTAYWFYGCNHLTEIVGINNLKTDNVTNMEWMFRSCSALTSLDVSGFTTDNVTNMYLMFDGCSSLTDLDVSNFKTSNVTNMGQMFQACYELTSLDLSHFNTANVTNMGGMFNSDALLTTLDLSTFNTSKVTEMSGMFLECPSLTTIYVGEEWSTANVTGGYEVFTGSTNLVGGKGTHYDPDHTDYTYARIDGGPNSQTPGYFTDKNAPVVTDPEPYAVLSDSSTVLTFYYDEHKEQRNGMSVGPFENLGSYGVSTEWYDNRSTITTVVFDDSFANCTTLTSTAYWFYQLTKLTTIKGIQNLKTDNVNDINSMFYDCESLTSLDLSNLNLGNVTNMHQVFEGCTGLENIIFDGVNTENVTNMGDLFLNCSSLKTIDLSSFNTNKVTNMRSMFYRCTSLTTVYVSDSWTTASVTEGNHMFERCYSIVGGKGTKFDENHIDATYARIDGGPDSETPGYFTRKGDAPWVEPGTPEPYAVLSDNNTVLTFYYDDQKEARNGMSVGPFPSYSERGWHDQRESITSVVFDASFAECTTLTSTAHWFYGCENLASITDISNLRTDNVTRMRYMFRYCSKLTSLDVSGFKTDNVTDMRAMFSHCSSLTSLDVSGFNTENVTDMMDMFDDCSKLTTIDVSHFNTEKVTNMSVMFQSCTSLTSLDLTNFNTSNVTNTQGMFYDCSNLVNLDIRTFDMSKVNNEEKNMFIGCSSLASIIAGSANILTEEYANIGNPNLLVYVNEARLAPEGVQNVVVNGVAKEIVLKDAEGNTNWYCPEPFRAEKISYTRDFRQQTQIGVSRGWESLALPFAVQTITHQDKGVIAPFGSDASGLHFWLRRLGHEGLISVQMIEPNTPYIISMPNSEDYASRFNLNGRVTFAAEDAYVERTEQMADESADYMMVPAFQRMPVSEYVYALNVGEERNGRPEGSIFERNYREVRPFEAYTLHRGDQPAPLFFDLSDLEGSTTDVQNHELLELHELSGDDWFTLDGRKLQKAPTAKGVYIHNGRKTVVR